MKKMISLLLTMMLMLSICPTNVEAAVPKEEDVITPQAYVNMYCPYCKEQGDIIDQFLDITSGIYCYVMQCREDDCNPNDDGQPAIWYYTFPINTIYGLEPDNCEHE